MQPAVGPCVADVAERHRRAVIARVCRGMSRRVQVAVAYKSHPL